MVNHFLLAGLALLSTGFAAPVHKFNKRSLPRLGGVNLAGCDFGMDTNGDSGTSECPGTDQIAHFVNDGANVFRLPVGWQYLVGSTTDSSSTSLDATFFATYDNLVKAVLNAGAYAMIDIHNYARWNGGIIGQGGPSNDDFASLWSLLATQYANEEKVIFGIMNEPHDVDINEWATTVQAAVNAIRSAGATSQTIAIPGTGYTGVSTWSQGTSDAMFGITDPATSDTSLLIVDAHLYLDSNGSGTSSECTTTGVDTLTSFAGVLSSYGWQAIISETGGGDTSSCITDLGSELKHLVENDNTFVGFTVWAAGSFATDYTLSVTPNGDTDNDLFVQAIQPYLPGSTASGSTSSAATSASTAASSTIASSAASSASAISAIVATSSATSSYVALTSTADATSTISSSTAGSSSVVDSSSIVVSSSAVATSSAAQVTSASSSSASAIYTAPSSSVVVTYSAAVSSIAPTTATATSSAASATSTGTNFQAYTGSLGGHGAPAVYASGTSYTSSGQTYNFLVDALNASCYYQMNECQAAANAAGNTGDLTVNACEGQVQACLDAASSASA